MNRFQEKELQEREAKRELILVGDCPHCKGIGTIANNEWFNQRNPKNYWFKCASCHTTYGIMKRNTV